MDNEIKKIKLSLWRSILLTCIVGLFACTGESGSVKSVISDTCSLDDVVGATGSPPTFAVLTNTEILFKGWMADAAYGRVPEKVIIELVNQKNQVKFTDSGALGEKRADVAAALKFPSVEGAGFTIKSKIQDVTPGEYEIVLVGIYGEQLAVCRSNRKLIIK